MPTRISGGRWRDHRHASFLRRAADAGNLYVARLGGAYAGGMVLGGAQPVQSAFDGSFFGRGFVWLIWGRGVFQAKRRGQRAHAAG